MKRSLNRLSSELHRTQRRDRKLLGHSVVGRRLELPKVSETAAEFARNTPMHVHYRDVGHRALVALFRDEMREELDRTYFNSVQVIQSIANVSKRNPTVKERLLLVRQNLWLTPRPLQNTPTGNVVHGVMATLDSAATITPPHKSVNTAKEELAVANELFLQDNDVTGQQLLWLGGISAQSTRSARQSLPALESLLPREIIAGPLQLCTPAKK